MLYNSLSCSLLTWSFMLPQYMQCDDVEAWSCQAGSRVADGNSLILSRAILELRAPLGLPGPQASQASQGPVD